MSPHPSDGLSGYTGARSRDASPPPNAGVISRPYSPYSTGGSAAGEFDSNLRRALSSDSSAGSEFGSGGDHLSSKFSPLPLTANSRTSSGGSLHGQGYPQRVQRSHSQPGPPPRGAPNYDYYPEDVGQHGGSRRSSDYGAHGGYHVPPSHRGGVAPGMDDYQYDQDMRYGGGGGGGHHNRSMSMQHTSSSSGYHEHQRRSSAGYYSRSMRDMDYDDGRRYSEHERIGNTGYSRGGDRMVSPGHSPMQPHYGHHSRASSDMGSTVSSSPMSFSSAQQPLYGRHRLSHSDEDLSHPLVGENIEVPGEEQYYEPGGMLPYPRSQSIGHPPSYGGESHHLPTAGASYGTPKDAYNVKFKRTQKVFEIGPRLTRDLKVGTYVKVEADRGEDLGIVVGKAKTSGMRSASFAGPPGELPVTGPGGDTKKITRLATHDEVGLLQMKREEEEELLKVCRTKVRQRGLPMHVVDAEYQFDRHKLTFFFEAEGRIDFRELVRDLFSIYKTRIWMQQLDKGSSATCPVAPAPAPLTMDYGTPIIAPASEYEEFAQANGAPDNRTD
ncbi:MAG: hypothetical protein SGARI_003011 [Bacillariaceae sp.]